MKIPPPSNVNVPARQSPETNRAAPRRAGATGQTAAPDDGTAATHESAAATRDFASVLEEVTKADKQQDDEGGGDERRDAKQTERGEREQETRRREERHEDASGRGGSFEQRHGGVREVSAAESAGARAILHVADLERIVSAVRAQALAEGGREVVIELKRSVLEGLRVRVSTDAAGRVTAEFIAASERVRAQLEGRTPELAELLRSRGVQLAALRTSVGAETSGGYSSRGDADAAPSARPAAVALSTPGAGRGDATVEPDGADEAANTYRA